MRYKAARNRLAKAMILMDKLGQLETKKQTLEEMGEDSVAIETEIIRIQAERTAIVQEILSLRDSKASEMLKQRYILGKSLARQSGVDPKIYNRLAHETSRAIEIYAHTYGYLDEDRIPA